jgi:hypothetical protein
MISVNTATLLTRAATWTLMMLMTSGSSMRMIATESTRCGLGLSMLNSLSSSGDATWEHDRPAADGHVGQPGEADEPAVGRIHQPGAPLVGVAGQRDAGAELGHDQRELIDGLSAQRVLYPGRVGAARQRQMLTELLDGFRPWPQ